MSPPVILKIREDNENITIAAKLKANVSIQTVNLKLLLATSWWEGDLQLDRVFEVIELTIKRALNQIYPHQKMVIDYTYTANDRIEDASEIQLEFNEVLLDDIKVMIEGDIITLEGTDERSWFQRLTSSKRKIEKNIRKTI